MDIKLHLICLNLSILLSSTLLPKDSKNMTKIRISILFFICLSCQTNKVRNISTKGILCNQIDTNVCYSGEKLIVLLHDSEFLCVQRNNAQNCFIQIINRLASVKKYTPHYRCDFFGCSYSSVRINDSSASIFRFDLKNLMTLYKFKDSIFYIEKYYTKFKVYDSLMINKYAIENKLQKNLDPIIIEK